MNKELIPVIQAMLKDEEFLRGGIFQKEKYYMEKYNLTIEQMSNIQVALYYALNIRNDYFNERMTNICK